MPQEKVFQDFSGGMNALAAVDKLDPRECLLAENVRLDETGNIQSAGAFTHQNTAAYAAGGGTNTNNVHSQYWNPALGAVAGVGQDVFQGATLDSQTAKLLGSNTGQQKMSFASAPNRVYFDVGSVGYWSDLNNLLTVDWSPPSVASAITTGPNTAVNSSSGTATNFGFALGTQSMQGVQATLVTTQTFTPSGSFDGTATMTVAAVMLVGGVAVGTSTALTKSFFGFAGSGPAVSTSTFTFGNGNTLWGFPTLTPTQVNAVNFGFVFTETQMTQHSSLTAVFGSTVTATAFQVAGGLVAGTGAAGTLTGTYTWKITFVAANGEESDASSPSLSVVLSAQQGTITAIPTGDGRTTARNIYRKGGALTSYYYVGTIPNNSNSTFSDNQSDIAALAAGIILAGDVPGDYPNSRLGNLSVRFPVLHYDRVFWVNQNQKNQLVWSKPLNGFAYPTINNLNVGDSTPISRTVSIFGELIIFKTNSQIWRLTGTDESSFDLTQTPASVSTDESFSLVALPDKILFHNRWGFWVFNGYTSQPLTPKLDLWIKQEDRTGKSLFGVNGFHPPEAASLTVPLNFEAVGNSEKFYFSYAEAGQTKNNALLVFDLKHGNITKRSVGALSLAIDPVNGYVYMGDSLGFVSLLDDWNGTSGGGSAINFDFQHGYSDLERGSNKALWALEFYLNTNGQALTPSVYYDNGLANETLTAISTTGLQRVVRTMEASQARKMQNFSWRLNGSLSKVNTSGTPGIQIVHVKALYDVRMGRARTGQT